LDALEGLGFKRLRETPIADLLFDFYGDKEMISAENFRAAMEAVLSASPSERLMTTFRVIAGKGNDTNMAFSRLGDFFERCWVVAAQTLVDKLKLAKQQEQAELVRIFAMNNISTLRENLRINQFPGEFITRADFTRFMAEDRNLQIAVGDVVVEMPTSFLFLQKTTSPVSAYPSLTKNK
jgi:hypothetical protein